MAFDGSVGLKPIAHPVLRTFIRIVRIALLCAAFCSVASAQSLQRLNVTQLTLAADTSTPQIEVPFHLIVTARVRERISELDNLDLPILSELELLGDEHMVTAARGGSTYRETITVVAHHSGTITIAPVTLDAIDARNGKPTRFSSNPLVLHVAGPSAAVVATVNAWQAIGSLFAALLRVLLWVLGIGVVLFIFAALIRRRPAQTPSPVVTLAPPKPVIVDPREQLREALAGLQRDRTRAGAMRARHIVRRMVGATDAETLADVLRRPLATDRDIRDLLRALERAGFTYDADLGVAIAAAIAQMERMTA
jgi:hypothetical protein